ncbi:hypothetical protein HII12_002026 [Brettanomyces bruxellensis]|uniref:Biogenesis of lysosome-related organelles complex 1 subunit KXD1 n=1 Tax=Dekkera bruxellensis TaxID=5007 RepID=A0A8H6EWY1_DEKBR|nr:hypothetical protein HII12_002026 [Brettanomyces bruxellensis]
MDFSQEVERDSKAHLFPDEDSASGTETSAEEDEMNTTALTENTSQNISVNTSIIKKRDTLASVPGESVNLDSSYDRQQLIMWASELELEFREFRNKSAEIKSAISNATTRINRTSREVAKKMEIINKKIAYIERFYPTEGVKRTTGQISEEAISSLNKTMKSLESKIDGLVKEGSPEDETSPAKRTRSGFCYDKTSPV